MRVDEIYLSVQGEGPRVGIPTIFCRFGGCNLRCPGWPCDTQHAIQPEFRDQWMQMTPEQINKKICDLIGGREQVNICFTGGEPFLQVHDKLEELHDLLQKNFQVGTIECFSNGTLLYPDWALDNVAFIMDWKLPGSGEDPYNDVRLVNLKKMDSLHAVKFVISDMDDFELAKDLFYQHLQYKSAVEVYYGVAWNKMTNATLCKAVLNAELPWRLNMQIHNIVWDRRKRGI